MYLSLYQRSSLQCCALFLILEFFIYIRRFYKSRIDPGIYTTILWYTVRVFHFYPAKRCQRILRLKIRQRCYTNIGWQMLYYNIETKYQNYKPTGFLFDRSIVFNEVLVQSVVRSCKYQIDLVFTQKQTKNQSFIKLSSALLRCNNIYGSVFK